MSPPAWPGTLASWGVVAASAVGSLAWLGLLAHLIRHRALRADLDAAVDPGAGRPDPPNVAVIVIPPDDGGPGCSPPALAAGDDGVFAACVDPRPDVGAPAGWLGAVHALQVATASGPAASAEWLVFVDPAATIGPGAIRRAAEHARGAGLDHLILEPGFVAATPGARTVLAFVAALRWLRAPIGRVADRRSRAAGGGESFQLVRAEAFRAVGGFHHLAMTVDAVGRLGQVFKYAGYRVGILGGGDAVRLRRRCGIRDVLRRVERDSFAAAGFRAGRAVAAIAAVVVLGVGPFVGLVVGPAWSWWLALAGVIALAETLAIAGRRAGGGWWSVVGAPVAAPLVAGAMARALVGTLARGGIVRDGAFHPLAALRAHARDRDAWLDEVWRSTR